MGDSIDPHLLKVGGLVVATVAGLVLVLSQIPGVVPKPMFGGGPVGSALTVGAVILGIVGYIILEVSAGEAFSD